MELVLSTDTLGQQQMEVGGVYQYPDHYPFLVLSIEENGLIEAVREQTNSYVLVRFNIAHSPFLPPRLSLEQANDFKDRLREFNRNAEKIKNAIRLVL